MKRGMGPTKIAGQVSSCPTSYNPLEAGHVSNPGPVAGKKTVVRYNPLEAGHVSNRIKHHVNL